MTDEQYRLNVHLREHWHAEVRRLRAEVAELREQLAGQKAINLRLAERLRACSEVLGRVAEKGDTVQGHTGGAE